MSLGLSTFFCNLLCDTELWRKTETLFPAASKLQNRMAATRMGIGARGKPQTTICCVMINFIWRIFLHKSIEKCVYPHVVTKFSPNWDHLREMIEDVFRKHEVIPLKNVTPLSDEAGGKNGLRSERILLCYYWDICFYLSLMGKRWKLTGNWICIAA